jgi:hypothetical protein
MGGAAESASERNDSKYSELTATYIFVPVACETFGPMSSKAVEFLSDLGRRIALVTGDTRKGSFLFQRISVAIQRFNCVYFKGTFIVPDT